MHYWKKSLGTPCLQEPSSDATVVSSPGTPALHPCPAPSPAWPSLLQVSPRKTSWSRAADLIFEMMTWNFWSRLVDGVKGDLQDGGEVRSPSSPQIHQKYIYMWNHSYRTPTECWQKTSDFPKGKKIPMYLGRAKEKKKKQRQKNRDGTCT